MHVFRVDQQLYTAPIADVEKAVADAMATLPLDVRDKRIAITAGSRGIGNIVPITKAVGDELKARGAHPFIVPCMGSHNGATAEGQRAMIESLGITEEAMQMPIRASMDVVQVGTVATGEVFMDRHCHESDGVLVLNRIKLHTCFSGELQSGLTKMMVIGMGKIRSARTFHNASAEAMLDMLREMGDTILASGKIVGGIAILEDGHDQTAEIHGVAADAIPTREPELLARHRRYFPSLPLDELNVLIVDTIGKTFSGTGMDTNVVGRRPDLRSPNIDIIGVLELSAASQGNAIGIGLADFTTRRLRDAIDEHKTLLNVLTTGDMSRAKIPATCADDEALVEMIRGRFGSEGWMLVPNTLQLETLYVSEDLCSKLPDSCTVAAEPTQLLFRAGRLQLDFSAASSR